MTREHTNRKIAEALSISIATVERDASSIVNKLGLHSPRCETLPGVSQ